MGGFMHPQKKTTQVQKQPERTHAEQRAESNAPPTVEETPLQPQTQPQTQESEGGAQKRLGSFDDPNTGKRRSA